MVHHCGAYQRCPELAFSSAMNIYLIALLVGGFFVLLSIFGGADSEADADVDVDIDADADFDVDVDADIEVDAEFDADAGSDIGAGPGFVDLLSLRALFLFAAFFGLTGTLLGMIDTGEPMTAIWSTLVGLAVGLGGNYFIKKVGYAHISSNVTTNDLRGKTGRVVLPFEGDEKGKIMLEVKGSRLQLIAKSEEPVTFEKGDEVVVISNEGNVVKVVKPN